MSERVLETLDKEIEYHQQVLEKLNKAKASLTGDTFKTNALSSQNTQKVKSKPKRAMSNKGKARIREAQKRRWAIKNAEKAGVNLDAVVKAREEGLSFGYIEKRFGLPSDKKEGQTAHRLLVALKGQDWVDQSIQSNKDKPKGKGKKKKVKEQPQVEVSDLASA